MQPKRSRAIAALAAVTLLGLAPGCPKRPPTIDCDPRWSPAADRDYVAMIDSGLYPALEERVDELQAECCARSVEDLPDYCGPP